MSDDDLWLLSIILLLFKFLFKSLGLVIFFMYFERSLLFTPRLDLFDQKYGKTSNIVKYYYNSKN